MPIFKAQKIPKKTESSESKLMRFCYYFPCYSFAQAKKMPFSRILKMLRVAEIERAINYAYLTRISVAPYTKGGKEATKLLEEFKNIIGE